MENFVAVKRSEVGFEVSDMLNSFIAIIMVVSVIDFISRSIISTSVAASQYRQTQPYASQTYANQPYFGMLDPRVLNAVHETGWVDLLHDPPYTPWITADFFNDGPDSVYIAINYPSVFSELHVGESFRVDFTGAERRIEVVFYKCSLGERALVRAIGKY